MADVTDADRNAPRVEETALDLHLNVQTGAVDARAKLLVRNGTAVAMPRLVLQLSSSLRWQSARLPSTGVTQELHQHRIVTDADHTGAATELILVLPKPLPPGATVGLELFYEGQLGTSTERLTRLGAPVDRAARSDWDTVSDRFTGLRGFGNVLWLPSAAPVALLAAGTDFVRIVEEQRQRNRHSRVALRLTVETSGVAPGNAFFLGSRRQLVEAGAAQTVGSVAARPQIAATVPASGTPPGGVSSSSAEADAQDSAQDSAVDDPGTTRLYVAEWPMQVVEDELPSLFLTASPEGDATSWLRVWTDNAAAGQDVQAAAERVRPTLQEWLGPRPARPLAVLDLPLAGAQPFAANGLLVTPLEPGDATFQSPVLVYSLAQAWLPRQAAPWLAEGVPEFLRLVYLERQGDRTAGLASMARDRALLVQQESEAAGAPLDTCVESACARTKGAYVLAMLRQIAGQAALKEALVGWLGSPPQAVLPAVPAAVSSSVDAPAAATGDTAVLERLLQTASGKDLRWFFADWIDRDAGLPDLAIVNVAPRRIERGTVTNTVPTERRPVGGPIGSEPVPQPGQTEQESQSTASRNRLGPREGSWLVAVEVQNNGGAAAEVPVTVHGSGLQNTLPLRVPAHGRATIRVPFETAPDEVTVGDGTTPEARTESHRRTITLPDAAK